MFQPTEQERKYKAMLAQYSRQPFAASIAMDRAIDDASEHLRLDIMPEDQHEQDERFDTAKRIN